MMQEKLRKYVEGLFKDVPLTKSMVELREEMIQNLSEKYQDLIQEGKTEEKAYNIAIGGIGDISSLIYDMDVTKKELSDAGKQKSAALTSIAVMAYIFSLIPIIVSLDRNIFYGLAVFIVIIMFATGLLIYNNQIKQKFYQTEETMVAEFKEWQTNKSNKKMLRVSISFALWSIIIALYFIVSITTSAWHLTWIIFFICIAIEALINIFFILRKRG